ncbi:MAG: anaerobic ribonucleoside-triphosphate reductase activating protein [Chitinivibrionia bacterium]|nr:anaerobic ribonucleoside-triphosphate reductase activating protein [Chitinivibrionia bacterium]
MSNIFDGICGLNKFSGNDFPGTVSTVLFYSLCNLRCPYCQNPDIVFGKTPQIDPELLADFLKRRKNVLDGVVITGGEPTIHKKLPELVEYIKKFGYKVKLDTNGLNPVALRNCDIDYLALDIKTTPKKYRQFLGASGNETQIRENLLKTASLIRKTKGELRITVAPKIIEKDDFEEIAEICEGMDIFLQKFRTKFEVLDIDFFKNQNHDDSFLKEFKAYLEKTAKSVKIRDYGENSRTSEKIL